MLPILDDLSSEFRLIVVYVGRFLMLRGFERIPQAEEEQLHDGAVLYYFGRRERRQ